MPLQVQRKLKKKGVEFNLLIMGPPSIGKTTLINSVFNTELTSKHYDIESSGSIQMNVERCQMNKDGVNLRLNIITALGYAQKQNNGDHLPVLQYIEDTFEKYMKDESGPNRRNMVDSRVHCCLYVLDPSSGLSRLDSEFMKRASSMVNLIPVIGKSDMLTVNELSNLKKNLKRQFEELEIKVFEIQVDDSDDRDYANLCSNMIKAIPFAVVGSNEIIDVKSAKRRARAYSWGIVEIENPQHCEFVLLKSFIITQMHDMIESTDALHYENYRCNKLQHV